MKNSNRISGSTFDKVGAPFLFALTLSLLYLETRRALRVRKESSVKSRMERMAINGTLASLAGLGLRFALLPAMLASGRANERSQRGLLCRLPLPQWLALPVGFLLLDYSNYLWHRLTHHLSGLWRFHQVHHSDLDLDVSTALRFHIGEILLSVFFRAGMIRFIGAPAKLVLTYEILFEAATSFHHSNWKLPLQVEQKLNRFLVTPRMHGIHHSIVREETDSNFCVIFNFWDRLHATLRLDVPQEKITIGMPSFQDRQALRVPHLLAMPFQALRPWCLPDGTVPKR